MERNSIKEWQSEKEKKNGIQRPFIAFIYPIIFLIYSAMSIYSFSFSLSLSSLFCLANFAAVFEGFVLLLALPRLTYIYQWQNLFRVSLSLSHSICCRSNSLSCTLAHTHTHTPPESPIFSFIYWYSFFNSHFFVANPEHYVIMPIHSYCIAKKVRLRLLLILFMLSVSRQ